MLSHHGMAGSCTAAAFAHLHEAAEAEDCVVEAAGRQELLCAVLHAHQRHLWVLVAVQDGAEDIAAVTKAMDQAIEQPSIQTDAGLITRAHTCKMHTA